MSERMRVVSTSVSRGGDGDFEVVARAMRAGLWIWPGFTLLDAYMCFVAYPGAPFGLFLGYRVAVELGLVAVDRAARRPDVGPDRLFRWQILVAGSAAVVIALMAIHLGGLRSPYMHGISIVALVWAVLVPMAWRRALPTMLVCALAFPVVMGLAALAAPALRAEWLAPESLTAFGANYVFVLASAGLSLVLSHMVWSAQQEVRRLGTYRLERLLGTGGMGQVWLATHRLLARRAAIKVVRPEVLGGDRRARRLALARFEQEARITASLRSPHTVALYDFGVSEAGAFYYVMELLSGFDAAELVTRFGPMPAERAVHVLRQMCDSLGEAHARGLVHRDVKPSNVYVCSYRRAADFVKVLDFGLVKPRWPGAPQLTSDNVVSGTPAFMSPEQVLGERETDDRSDLYSVGCVAYWLLTGAKVFEGRTAMEIMLKHVREAPVPPSQRTELAIPSALEALVMACLAKDPALRPPGPARPGERAGRRAAGRRGPGGGGSGPGVHRLSRRPAVDGTDRRAHDPAMSRTPPTTAAVALLVVLGLTAASAQQHWPRFRGSAGGVAADDPQLPERWGPEENVAWRLDVPGRSWSSPVVWGDHVFVLTAINTVEEERLKAVSEYVARSAGGPMTFRDIASSTAPHSWMLYDVDLETGRIRWEREVARAVPAQSAHLKSSFASETPVTDGERVFVYVGHLGLFAFDFEGAPLWSQPMTAHEMLTGFGTAKSPVVDDRHVYVVHDNEEQSFIAAFDKTTGEERWRVDREETSNWTTPYVWQNDLRTEIVTAGSGGVWSYGVDGAVLWQLTGMSSFAVPSPFSNDGLLYVTSGYTGSDLRPAYAIRPGASGDITLAPGETSNDFIVWSDPRLGAFHPSALVYGGCYYQLHDRGFLTCNDPATGEEIYGRQRVATDASGFTASPWAYNGKLFALSEDGDTYVVRAGPEFEVLGKNSLGEMALATPAVAGGSLIIRTATALYRIGAGD